MKLRKIVFWLHLTAGLIAGAVVLIMSVTGVLLTFERQLTEWADRDLRVTPPTANAAFLPLTTLLASVHPAQSNAQASGLTIRSDPTAPTAINFGRERALLVNPYTGAVLGEGSTNTRAFFRSLTNLHRWLAVPDEDRAIGRAVTGACNFAFLFLVVSGFYLWWPRRWTKSAGRAIVVPRLRLRGKARDFNWHNAIGFWSAPFLFFIVLSGVIMSYPWATGLLYRLTNSEPPPAQANAGRRGQSPTRAFVIPPAVDRLRALATEHVPDWQTISIRLEGSSAPLSLSLERGPRGRPDLRSQWTLDATTGEIAPSETFSSFSLGRRLRTWARFVHTGEAGGAFGQTLAGLASAGAVVLVWTGFALAWRRFRARKRQVTEATS